MNSIKYIIQRRNPRSTESHWITVRCNIPSLESARTEVYAMRVDTPEFSLRIIKIEETIVHEED